MLDILRKRSQSIVIQALVLLIAVVFIFWGVGSNLDNNRNSIAVVNGREISLQEFQKSYDRTVESYREQFGGQIPQGFLEGLGLDRQVLNQLIQAEILRQGGEKIGINISKEATQLEIKQMEVFRQNGQFDLTRYKEVLSRNSLTPTSFEGGIRTDLLTRRVADAVRSFAMVPESEVQAWLDFADEEVKLAYTTFKSDDFVDKVEVEDAGLAAWFEQHKQEYQSEPKIRLKYLFFSFDQDMAEFAMDEEATRSRYESEISKYQRSEQRHARHILFQVTGQDADAVRAAKRKKAEEVLVYAKSGEDFAELAGKYSEGPTKTNGGDLGFFARGRMVKEFDDTVFSMKPGHVSDIVETSFGYHIIKLEEVRPAFIRPFDEVKEEIVASMKKEGVKGLTFKRASSAYEEIMRAGSLARYSENSRQEVVETDYFARSTPPEGITGNGAFLASAFSLQKGELSSLVELDSGYAVLFVDDIEQAVIPALEAVRERVVTAFKKEKAVDQAREAAEKLLADSREQGKIEDDVSLEESTYVKRTASPADSGLPALLIEDAFTLAGKTGLPDKIITVGNTLYVYELRDRRQSEEKADDARRGQLEEQLLATRENRLVANWLAGMREQADIWINNKLLK
ncbi:MAG: hypothetical protein GQ559_08015 [Desulfobulbaceae bacterium]|nr:hypothetical protein [Desulfobulbaceae bacterium]